MCSEPSFAYILGEFPESLAKEEHEGQLYDISSIGDDEENGQS